ncbi:hypothetical protein [Polaromonas sp. CG9_12]|nr:hypothetical protein [Polaromonas sp. CG9_12]
MARSHHPDEVRPRQRWLLRRLRWCLSGFTPGRPDADAGLAAFTMTRLALCLP